MADLFDILGPSMIGPSSSHTAGASRLGFVTASLLGERPERALIELHGSFAMTGEGHGTKRAIVGGLLGMRPDDPGLRDSLERAADAGLQFSFASIDLGDEAHPNTARIRAAGAERETCMLGCSVGGGRVLVQEIDGMKVSLSGTMPTVVVLADDVPGTIAEITGMLADRGLNLATMRVDRTGRGERALMTIEADGTIPPELAAELSDRPWVHWVRTLGRLD
ncbi:MAG: L-serine ammonia-lyase, iron-sulfur-dependent subunit beta [Gemmatimonadota bacterium]